MGHGDISLIKGVTATSSKRVKFGTPSSRRLLKHMKYDKRSGHFVCSKRNKLIRMHITNMSLTRILQCLVSRDSLADLDSISNCFPMVRTPLIYRMVEGVF